MGHVCGESRFAPTASGRQHVSVPLMRQSGRLSERWRARIVLLEHLVEVLRRVVVKIRRRRRGSKAKPSWWKRRIFRQCSAPSAATSPSQCPVALLLRQEHNGRRASERIQVPEPTRAYLSRRHSRRRHGRGVGGRRRERYGTSLKRLGRRRDRRRGSYHRDRRARARWVGAHGVEGNQPRRRQKAFGAATTLPGSATRCSSASSGSVERKDASSRKAGARGGDR